MKILLPLAALAAGFTFAPAAQARDIAATVRVADLDLSSAQGVARLDTRIARAARHVCRPEASFTPAASKVRACTEATLATHRILRDAVVAQASGGSAIQVVAAR